jgi:hypothetical protein
MIFSLLSHSLTRRQRAIARRLVAICLLGYGIWFCFVIPEWSKGFVVIAVAWFGFAIYLLVGPVGRSGVAERPFPSDRSDWDNGGNGNGGDIDV